MSRSREQMIAALRRQLLAQWVLIIALVVAIVILLIGRVEAAHYRAVDKPGGALDEAGAAEPAACRYVGLQTEPMALPGEMLGGRPFGGENACIFMSRARQGRGWLAQQTPERAGTACEDAVELRPKGADEAAGGEADAATPGRTAGETVATVAIEPEPVSLADRPGPVDDAEQAVSLGAFTLYAYCPCVKCCGQWSPKSGGTGQTASGVYPRAGRTIGVDPEVIPLGSLVMINGAPYIAEDTGAGVRGQVIDIFHETHEAAMAFGRKEAEVWLVG